MDTQYTGQSTSHSSASWWIMVFAGLLIGLMVGYYFGVSGIGTGLISEDEDAVSNETSENNVTAEIEADADEPANPFEDDGYQNPFE